MIVKKFDAIMIAFAEFSDDTTITSFRNQRAGWLQLVSLTGRVPRATAKQRHRLVLFSLLHNNANERYSYRTETLLDVTGCVHNRKWRS